MCVFNEFSSSFTLIFVVGSRDILKNGGNSWGKDNYPQRTYDPEPKTYMYRKVYI
jgi:hypothetical protein